MHRILIVSDNTFLRKMVCWSLTDIEAEVRTASGMGEVERLCGRTLFDVVIVLCASPFLSGRDPVKRLRPQGLKRPLFYVVSWQQSEQTVLSLLENGVDQYMTFPLNLQRLRTKVANELSRQI